MKTLILGYGNPGRGDDGLGPELVARLEKHPVTAVTLLAALQLQPEHVFDLADHDRVLLVDAGLTTPAPFTWDRLHPARDPGVFTHALGPRALLAIYREALRREPPVTWLVTIRGERFGLGESLSEAARRHLARALESVTAWLADARTVPG